MKDSFCMCVRRGNDAYFLSEQHSTPLWAALKLVTGEENRCSELTRESCQVTNPHLLIKAPARHICCLHAYASSVTSAALALQRGHGSKVYLLRYRESTEHKYKRWMVQAIKANGGTMFRVASFFS